MQNVKEYLLGLIDGEQPAFIKVFEALPTDKLDWKPDPKSRTALELASQIADEPVQLAKAMADGKIDFDPTTKKVFSSMEEVVSTFKSGMEKTKAALMNMDDNDWEADAVMMMNGQEMWKTKKGQMALGYMLDLIHHRGQLATYIRPMGGKVPSIYGPSADMNE